MNATIENIIKQAIESRGYEVRIDGNVLYVDDEDTNTEVRITIEVVP